MKLLAIPILSFLLLCACQSKPKVISAEGGDSAVERAHAHLSEKGSAPSSGDLHTVVCRDFMHTDKYTYLDVEENGERFWIAVPKQEVEKGATYHYAGGLMKTNFKSVEFDRVFDKIYLVSAISRHDDANPSGGSAVDRALAQAGGGSPGAVPVNQSTPAESVKISELFENRGKYEGKTITVTGDCVKINKMIMGRNWVHISDGSLDGDLTVTTLDDVPVGAHVSMTGTIALNKDFGAGYRYEVIMESASVAR